jgi:ribonuclease HII
MPPSFAPEEQLSPLLTIGIDEAGRGPLAGSVVAGAVYIPCELKSHPIWREVNDSKKMTAIKRDICFEIITKLGPYGVGIVSASEIDRINILQATFEAMRRATINLSQKFSLKIDHAILDGNRVPKEFPCNCSYLIKGDSISTSIAAASIIAKVTRDRMMTELALTYPEYGFETHAGYGTPEHLKALETYGFCAEHRKSFEPIKSMIKKVA